MEPGSPSVPAFGASLSKPAETSESMAQTGIHENAGRVPQQRDDGSNETRSSSTRFSQGAARGGGRGRAGKRKNVGRSEWAPNFITDLLSKTKVDKRKRNEDEQDAKRQRLDEGKPELPIYATKFSDDVLAAEERKPKKKVAVLIGYAGTGYSGMQFTHDRKTIEGDLFQAFVAAGAISKANADDPKKSSFVRCARTDKGVHAAGNVISLKLIIEDKDIVKKINDNLSPQIRVWGFERTNNSFSAYQLVDSRIYEYLIPTHSFLPPHPSSFLGRKCEQWAEQKGDMEAYRQRQEEVSGYWEKVDEEVIKPILAEYDEDTRSILEKALWLKAEEFEASNGDPGATEPIVEAEDTEIEVAKSENDGVQQEANREEADSGTVDNTTQPPSRYSRSAAFTEALKRLRQAYVAAKRTYRIPKQRLDRVQECLSHFIGTRNFHNHTISKSFRDPSSMRVIKSFTLNLQPILINGTEWVSMKVHGQSFMMHQIRKMVGMTALVVRCGCDPKRMVDSLGRDNISIPKAPSLGLLLERPVFDSYNKRASTDSGKGPIDFDKYKSEMDAFKQAQIYERMYRDEEKDNVFGNFFNHIDNFPSETFLFLTSGGIEASKIPVGVDGKPTRRLGDHAFADGDVDLERGEGDSDVDETVKDNHGDEG